jgi:hypothetical protein
MSGRKYRYAKPRDPKQCVEAMYEELSFSPRELIRDQPTETLKDYVAALLGELKKAGSKRECEKEQENYSVSWALGALAVVGLVFLITGFSKDGDWEWLNQHRFAVKLWGVAFAAVFVGVSIERSSYFKSLWAFGITKVIASLAVSALVVFSTGKAGSLINAVFPIDASALPFTRAIVAGLLAFKYAYPLLAVVTLFALLHALNAANWVKQKVTGEGTYEMPPLQSFAFLVLALVVLSFFTRWVNRDFSDAAWPVKVYRLAHTFDFNSKYECTNLRKGLSVVFLGPDHTRVLADVSAVQTDDLESFVDAGLSGQVSVPPQFYVLPCEVPVPESGG